MFAQHSVSNCQTKTRRYMFLRRKKVRPVPGKDHRGDEDEKGSADWRFKGHSRVGIVEA
jgi:hypothetical protein